MRKKSPHPERLPKFYEFILRLPTPSLQRFPNAFQGIFWAIITPLFLVSLFFLGLFMIFYFPFPLNLGLALIIPTIIFVIFIRMRLEIDLNFLHLIMSKGSYEWNIENALKEYVNLLQEAKDKKRIPDAEIGSTQ